MLLACAPGRLSDFGGERARAERGRGARRHPRHPQSGRQAPRDADSVWYWYQVSCLRSGVRSVSPVWCQICVSGLVSSGLGLWSSMPRRSRVPHAATEVPSHRLPARPAEQRTMWPSAEEEPLGRLPHTSRALTGCGAEVHVERRPMATFARIEHGAIAGTTACRGLGWMIAGGARTAYATQKA